MIIQEIFLFINFVIFFIAIVVILLIKDLLNDN